MQLQLENISSLKYCSLIFGGFILTASLVWLPLTQARGMIFLGILTGIVVIPFLELSFALRYISGWLVLAGGAGLLSIGGNYLEPLLGHSKFLVIQDKTAIFSTVLYASYLTVGLVIMRWRPPRAK